MIGRAFVAVVGAVASTVVFQPRQVDALVVYEEIAKLVAPGVDTDSDRFGAAVAVSGDTIVIGAPHWGPDEAVAQGAAYVFVVPRPGATPEFRARLTASEPQEFDNFGAAVAIDGDTIVVGAWGADSVAGKAYLFNEPASGWATATEDAVLTASDRGEFPHFGLSVSISNDTIVVLPTARAQRAYVFVEPEGGWSDSTEQAILMPPAGLSQDVSSVDVDGDTIVLGLHSATVGGVAQQGATAVFVEPGGGWGPGTAAAAVLTASDGAAGDRFGFAAVSDDTIAVGASGADIAGERDRGAAYVFVRPAGGWTTTTETAKLTAAEGDRNDALGWVDIDDDTVLAGSLGALREAGAAYRFVAPASGWATTTETDVLIRSDDTTFRFFGFPVAIDADTAVLGAQFDDVDGQIGAGSAYVFDLSRTGQPPGLTLAAGGRCGSDQRSATIDLTVHDPDGSPASLTLSATSTNPALIPPQSIVFGGNDADRTMLLRTVDGMTGTAFVDVSVTDGTATARTTVVVRATGDDDDTVIGTPDREVLLTQGGNDTVKARAGKDVVCGGDGDDRLEGGDGGDSIDGGAGTNVLIGGEGHDQLDGGAGDDVVLGGPGRDRLAGGDGSDTLRGGLGQDMLFGGLGADRMFGDESADRLTGGNGPDRFSGGAGTDVATDLDPATGDSQDGTIP